MKKMVFILLAIITVLTACSPDTVDDGTNTGKDDLLQDLKSYIQQAENPAEVKDYLNGLMEDADGETSGKLILEYLDYMDSILSGSVGYEKDVLERAGFKFINVEGNEQPIIDYHFIEAYFGQLSQEMLDFTAFMVLNSDEPWAKDAAILIPLTDLADRIAQGEQFLVRYPDSAGKEKVRTQYRYYLLSFLGGLDNTPLVDYDLKAIDPKFIDAFQYFLDTYPVLKTAKTVETLQTELKASGFLAPYTYGDEEKQTAFQNHIDALVTDAENGLK